MRKNSRNTFGKAQDGIVCEILAFLAFLQIPRGFQQILEIIENHLEFHKIQNFHAIIK